MRPLTRRNNRTEPPSLAFPGSHLHIFRDIDAAGLCLGLIHSGLAGDSGSRSRAGNPAALSRRDSENLKCKKGRSRRDDQLRQERNCGKHRITLLRLSLAVWMVLKAETKKNGGESG